MSQHPDENGLVPDDALLVRPYVATSGPAPTGAEAPAWPQTGPFAFPGPAHGTVHGTAHSSAYGPDTTLPAPESAPTTALVPAALGTRTSARAGTGTDVASRSSRRPVTVVGLLALAAVGALVLLLTGPDPEPPRAEPPADLSLPALPARSPDTGTQAPGPAPSARPAEPSATATATGVPQAAAGPGTKPPTAPSASAVRPSSAYVTLRMGDSGPEVRALQELLHGQGFTYVSVTGVYDGQTKRGVGQLQRDRSIKGDPQGVYGPNTQAALQ
ncbi:peptidoglycan-binding protein [Streptomyces erythrochromogenes]|uniref:peptidoglycan-binding protein n=1 Tax=Streptomyces erythrochromogenes TaxID=285574 RepID=UPI003806AF93